MIFENFWWKIDFPESLLFLCVFLAGFIKLGRSEILCGTQMRFHFSSYLSSKSLKRISRDIWQLLSRLFQKIFSTLEKVIMLLMRQFWKTQIFICQFSLYKLINVASRHMKSVGLIGLIGDLFIFRTKKMKYSRMFSLFMNIFAMCFWWEICFPVINVTLWESKIYRKPTV